MMTGLLRLLAKLPLSWFHAAGSAIGWAVYLLSPVYASRLRENLLQSGLCRDESHYQGILQKNVAESGKAVMELIPVWFRPVPEATRLVQSFGPMALIEEAERRGNGIIFLTPHLGCFDIAALWAAQQCPMTVLYRPPKLAALQPLIEAGRARGNVTLAPTNLGGVRLLLKALRRNQTVGILPDQAPGVGEGAWAEFFGRPAYTMTLVGRLVEATGASVIVAIAERLAGGKGFVVRLAPLPGGIVGEKGPRNMNAAIEEIVKLRPEQYLWSYNRYKVPQGVEPPPGRDRGQGARGDN